MRKAFFQMGVFLIIGTKFVSFNHLEVQALVTADIEGYVDNIRMRQITGKHPTDITKLLQNLVIEGALSQDGQGRWTRYSISKDFLRLHKSYDSVHKKISNSVHKEQKSLKTSALGQEYNSVHKENYSVHKTPISNNDLNILHQIAKLARHNQRLSPKKMEQIILNLCQDRWLNRKQLANLLKRNSDGLRSRFLTQMVGHGLLRLRYPDKPNRIDQAYTAAE